MALQTRRLQATESMFGLEDAGRLLLDTLPGWMQDLDLLVESVECSRPVGAPADWQPGAVIRLPFSRKVSRDGVLCPQALLAVADTAMTLACAAAWNGYRATTVVDQTVHVLRPVNFDVLADARIIRIARNTTFGRVMLTNAVDRRPVAMASSAYAML